MSEFKWQDEPIDRSVQDAVDAAGTVPLVTYASCSGVPSEHDDEKVAVFGDDEDTLEVFLMPGYLAVYMPSHASLDSFTPWVGGGRGLDVWQTGKGDSMVSFRWTVEAESLPELEVLAKEANKDLAKFLRRLDL